MQRRSLSGFPKIDIDKINPNEAKSAKTTCVAGKPCDWSLSEPWTGFTQFTTLNETPPGRIYVVQERNPATMRPDHLWQVFWSRM